MTVDASHACSCMKRGIGGPGGFGAEGGCKLIPGAIGGGGKPIPGADGGAEGGYGGPDGTPVGGVGGASGAGGGSDGPLLRVGAAIPTMVGGGGMIGADMTLDGVDG